MALTKRRWMLLIFACALASAPVFCAAASDEAEELAANLSAKAQSLLDSFLGPGRSKVLITVEVNRTNTQAQSELMTPVINPQAPKAELPGYFKPPSPQDVEAQKNAINDRKNWDFVQKNLQESTQVSGLTIKRMRVSVILDSSLSADQAELAARIVPDLLHIDSARGDEIAIVRAPLIPLWKSIVISPDSLRLGFLTAGVLALILILSFMAYLMAMRLMRTFAFEMTSKRMNSELPPGLPGGPLPELLPEGIPGLGPPEPEPGAEPGETADENRPALGRRFDFLSSKEPREIAQLLGDESAQDIALMFGYLADSNPELASSIFSVLPAQSQAAVSHALASLKIADPERLAMLENRLKNIVEFGVHGPQRLGKILSRIGEGERTEIIESIMSSNPQAAEEVERELFSFEELAGLETSQLRRLLVAVSYKDWGLALRGAPEAMVNQILELLLPGTREMLRESMEAQQPRAKVLEARSKILTQAQEMAARGEIVLKRKGIASDMI